MSTPFAAAPGGGLRFTSTVKMTNFDDETLREAAKLSSSPMGGAGAHKGRISPERNHMVIDVTPRGKRLLKNSYYVNNPKNKFTVTVLGAVAELERA
jgi:hypothetical protein